MEWQPIESAPKDGSAILLHAPNEVHQVCMGKWREKAVRWMALGCEGIACDGAGDWQYVLKPTHWMPLPEPPK